MINILQRTTSNENVSISIEISLKYVYDGLIVDISMA